MPLQKNFGLAQLRKKRGEIFLPIMYKPIYFYKSECRDQSPKDWRGGIHSGTRYLRESAMGHYLDLQRPRLKTHLQPSYLRGVVHHPYYSRRHSIGLRRWWLRSSYCSTRTFGHCWAREKSLPWLLSSRRRCILPTLQLPRVYPHS